MSCISLRLPPARKVWKSFTSKLGTKLHNIRKSKTTKKHRNNLKTKTTKPSSSITTKAPKFIATKRIRHKRFATVRSVLCSLQKKPAPVYIDKLFKEPNCDLVEYLKPQTENYKPRIEIVAEKNKMEEGTSKGCEKTNASDDMWESVALASPQMKGIDERAEEFITKFRKQMAAQERLARNL